MRNEPIQNRWLTTIEKGAAGFTLVELLAVVVILSLLGLALVPARARARTNSKAFVCQNNMLRVTAAWAMYSADHNDRVANNFGITDTLSTIQASKFDNWVNNVMTWGRSISTTDIGNTNLSWVEKGPLGSYLGNASAVYRCPSDNYLSPAQAAAGWTGRLRSISMNAVFGRFSAGNDSTASGLNWAFPAYVQYVKQTRVLKPALTWLLIEEHPDSINDGYFVNNPSTTAWADIPSSLHDGSCAFSFADGHSELKRWQSSTSCYRVQYYYPPVKSFDVSGRADFNYYLSRTGWVDARTGQPLFGY